MTALTLVAIGVLYVGLALTCVLVLGPRLPDTKVPLSELLTLSFGNAASAVTATLAAVLTFGALNSYLAGTLPAGRRAGPGRRAAGWLAKGHRPARRPRRSLAVIAGCATAVTIVAGLLGASLGDIILATSAMLLVGDGGRPGRGRQAVARSAGPIWWGAILAAVAMAVVLLFSGFFLALPLGLALAAHALHPDQRVPARAGRPNRPPLHPAGTAPNRRSGPADWPEPVPAVGTGSPDPE